MKYKEIYWTLFAPMIKKSVASRFNKELAKQSIRQGKEEYRRLLSCADDLGSGNPMARYRTRGLSDPFSTRGGLLLARIFTRQPLNAV